MGLFQVLAEPVPGTARVDEAAAPELHPRASMVAALGSALAPPLATMRLWSGCQRCIVDTPPASAGKVVGTPGLEPSAGYGVGRLGE